jgi:hypothetical protein
LAYSVEKVLRAGQPLSEHDVVVSLEFEELLVLVHVLFVGEDPFEMPTPIILLLGLKQYIPILHIQPIHTITIIQIGQLPNIPREYLLGHLRTALQRRLHPNQIKRIRQQRMLDLGIERRSRAQ